MVALDKSVDIAVPASRVWDVLARLAGVPAWCPGVVRVTAAGGSACIAPGARVRVVREDLGMQLESENEVTLVEPLRRLAWRQRAGDFAAHETRFELSPAPGGGTRVRVRVRFELPFVLPRMVREDELVRHYSRAFDHALLNLKEHLEGPATPPASHTAGFMAPLTAHHAHDEGRARVHAR